ncbi:MAG: cysteine desulfurase [Clostridiales bacterium]|nr:cysteine desulfurase [Clostridiales bacterium]
MEIYFDNSATTKPYDEVAAAVFDTMKNNYGNPSSLHKLGIEAERAVKQAKERVAAALKVSPGEIFFTSGGTESDNIAILGVAKASRGRHIISTPLEHPAVLNTLSELESRGYHVDYAPVGKDGKVILSEFKKLIRPDTILVTAMLVNNEIGTIEPVAEMSRILKSKNHRAVFHVDAVQGFGKIPMTADSLGADLISLSSHKIHGPKGMGALYIRKGTRLRPIMFGGGQQQGIRSGTENVPGIVGFGLAAKIAVTDLNEKTARMEKLKTRLRNGIKNSIDNIMINTPENNAPHILNVSFGGAKAEVVLHSLEMQDIYVSSGSACSSHKKEPSYVLTEIGVPRQMIDGSIRFSLSEFNTEEDVDTTVEVLKKIIPRLRKLNMR